MNNKKTYTSICSPIKFFGLKKLSLILVAIVFLFRLSTPVSASTGGVLFAGGNGSPGDPFLIANVDHLQAIRNASNSAHFRLINDIDASATATWNGGQGFNPVGWYNGTIDGDGYTISGLVINRPGNNESALITQIGSAGVVKNIEFENVTVNGAGRAAAVVGTTAGILENITVSGTINGTSNVGGIVGQIDGGGIASNISFTGSVTGTSDRIGGIVGLLNSNATLEDATMEGTVSGSSLVGGLAGQNNSGSTITNAMVNADVLGAGNDVGGATGYNNGGSLSDVSFSGSVNGNQRVGGLVGKNEGNVTNGHVVADVAGVNDNVGGLVGLNNNGILTDVSAAGNVNGNNRIGGLVGFNGYGSSVISNAHSTADVAGSEKVGGLIGFCQDGLVEHTYSTGSVQGKTEVGGLIGFVAYGSALVKTSFSTSNVTGSNNEVGGLVGKLQSGQIQDCYATGEVQGNNRVGGLVGEMLWNAIVSNSFSNGLVIGSGGQTGGLVGRNQQSNTVNSFWDTETSNQNSSEGGTPRTTSQMLDPATFAAWDFNNIWSIDPEINNGYPYLIPLGGFFMMVWTGAINTAWENPGNWSTGNVPLPNETVRIPNVTNQPLISSFVVVNNMNIQPNADVTIGHNGSLTVSTTINNMAGANGLIIISNEDGTGSLIHNNNGVQATFQRYVPGLPEAWHMLSSPMTNQAITGSFTPPGDYADGTGYDFYTWYAPDTSWVYLLNDMFPPTWLTANGSNNFVVGRGYLVSYQQPNPTLTFSGTLNNGLINIGLTSNPGDTTLYGVNLIGNPYPSSIDWKAATGWDRSPLELSGGGYDIWIWNDEHENYGAYNSASAVDIGTLGVTRYIPPTQGFFVSATQTGNLVMDNTIRVHDGADNWLKTSAADTEKIFLAVTPDDGTNRDEVMIEFKTRDYTGGTRKKFSFIPTAPSLFIPHNGKNYSLRMLGNVENHPVIPVSFNAGRNGNYTISADFDKTSFDMLVLEDKLTGRKQDMLSDQNYAFYASTGDDPRRFVLHLKEGHYADPHEVMPVRIFTYASSIYLDMRLLDHGEMCRMEIVDLLGRRVYQQRLAGGNLESIFMPEMNGLFIVILSGNRGVISRKVYF